MRKVDDKRVHKALTALAIGGPAGSDAQMMSLLESIEIGKRRLNKSAERIAFRDHPLPNPSMTRWSGPRFLLGSTREKFSSGCQRTLHDAAAFGCRRAILSLVREGTVILVIARGHSLRVAARCPRPWAR